MTLEQIASWQRTQRDGLAAAVAWIESKPPDDFGPMEAIELRKWLEEQLTFSVMVLDALETIRWPKQ